MFLLDLPDGVIETVVRACDADADAANLSASCASIRRVAGAVLDVRRVLRRAKARGARYAEMLRLSAEYEAIPESCRLELEDWSPSGTMSWHRIDSRARCSDLISWPIEHGQHYLERLKARQIVRTWFDLLVVGDVLSPGGVVKEKSAYGNNQGILDGGYICYLYPTSRVLVPPRTDTVLV
jgi:hypothetical protein